MPDLPHASVVSELLGLDEIELGVTGIGVVDGADLPITDQRRLVHWPARRGPA